MERVTLMVSVTRGKTLLSTIRKLSLALTVYCIWNERNKRLHDKVSHDTAFVLRIIIDTIRSRLLSFRGIPDSEENRALLSCWSLEPDMLLR